MKRTREQISKQIAKELNTAVVFYCCGNHRNYDKTAIAYPSGEVELFATGACTMFYLNKKRKAFVENEKIRLEKKLSSIDYIGYNGANIKNYQ